MRNFKRFLSLVVAALLLVSAMATGASAAKFTDVPVDDAALTDAVELLVSLGVTKGTTETTFGTTENVTRQQMAAFAYRMMKAGKSVEGGSNTTAFTDLTDPTYNFMISWTSNQGIIKGRTATTFDPKGGIILQDAYTMLVRALGWDDGTYSYPINYIDKAEELGLDENLPSTLGYKDTLTRGDLAIILANMFYADTAETEIRYETAESEDGKTSTITPVEYHLTLAEKVFEVTKIAQKVVATPNKAFEGYEPLEDDVAMVELTMDVVDADDYDLYTDLGVYTFEELGLEGDADDYFLSDILMFVKWNDRTDKYDIYGATAQGSVKTVSFEDITFGTVSGTSADKYYDGTDKEYKKFSGKLDIDGVTAYLFDAPYSFHKQSDVDKKDEYNSTFITMVNITSYDYDEGKLYTQYAPVDVTMDDTIVGTYEDGAWTYDGYLSQVYFGGLGEVECYDSNGDGKYEFLFVKEYSLGEIDTKKDTDLAYTVKAGKIDEKINISKVILEGAEVEDEDIVLAYVNKDANYVQVVEVLTSKTVEIVGTSVVDDELAAVELDDETVVDTKHLVATTANGNTYNDLLTVEDIKDTPYDAYYTAAGKLVAFESVGAGVDLNENWVIMLEEKATKSTALVDGKMTTAWYINVYNDGATKALKVAGENIADADQYELATAKANSKTGNYTITGYDGTATTYASYENIAGDDESDYAYINDASDITIDHVGGSRYTIGKATVNFRDYSKIIILSPADKDEKDAGEKTLITVFDAENLPDIKDTIKFKNVSFILTNNAKSERENLVVFFGTTDEVLKPATGEVADIQIVTGISSSKTADGKVNKYNVIGADGRTATYTGSEIDAGDTGIGTGSIVVLTTNDLIDEEIAAKGNVFNAGAIYNTEDDFEGHATIGYVSIAGYDEGILEVSGDDSTYYVTEDTVIIRVDKSDKAAEALEVADADAIFDYEEYNSDDLFVTDTVTAVLVVEKADDFDDQNPEYNVLNVIVVQK